MHDPSDRAEAYRALAYGRSGPGAGGPNGPGDAGGGPFDPSRHYPYAPTEEVSIGEYWQVIRRRRWTVIVCFLVTVIAATVWTFTTRPVYTATATLRIEREEPRVVKFEEVVRADPEETYYQTQYNILRSRSLANRVITQLGLDKHEELLKEEPGAAQWLETAKSWVVATLTDLLAPADHQAEPDPVVAEDELVPESPLTSAFQARLSVSPMRDTRLVRVSFDSYYPELSASVVNALADAFIERNLDYKSEATRYATEFLAQQMEAARAKLEESEQRLNRFLKANDIFFLGGDSMGGGQALTTQELGDLSARLLQARADRIAKESALAQARRQDPNTLPAVLQNQVIQTLKAQLVALEGEQQQLAQVFTSRFDDVRMRQLKENIRELRRRIEVETARVVASLEGDYRAAVQAEERLRRAAEQQRRLARRLGDQMVHYNLLRREVESNREIFSSLLDRLKETGVSAALLSSNISIVDRAEVPLRPSKPAKTRNLLVASLIGVITGVGLAFLREQLDTTVKDTREVERALGVPTLALIPSWAALEGRKTRRHTQLALAAHTRMGSAFAEAFRALRTSLLFSGFTQPPRTVMITSLHRDDGKTSLATNLAIVLAQLNVGEVLLVDGDMRRPRLHDLLGVPQAPGLSTYLSGEAPLSDVVKPTHIPNLLVLPSGEIPVNPTELMSSARLQEANALIRQHFAHVVFDTPPLFGISDAMVLAPQVEGVVLVLRRGRASREAAQRAVRVLASMRARLLGVILNDVDVRGTDAKDVGYYGYSPSLPDGRS